MEDPRLVLPKVYIGYVYMHRYHSLWPWPSTCVNFDPLQVAEDCQNNKEGVHVQPTLRRRYVRWEYQRAFDTRGVRGG